MSTNPLRDLAVRTERLAGELATIPAKMVEAAAVTVETSVNAQINSDAPRHQVAGGRVGVKHLMLQRSPANAAAIVKATGPLHLLANPTKPHPEKARRKQALRTPYGPRYSVQHPGTKGKDTWHKGVDRARPAITAVTVETGATVFRRAFQ